ncbi:hypothetical protein HY990_02190 [Candidatus Micrarchaeota archaeon]|nr:hypothetical protein [Candidatus Micrarchaeota archaeon]
MIHIVEINQNLIIDPVAAAAQTVVTQVVALLPGFIAAILVLVLGWVVSILVSRLFARLFKLIKFEEFLKQNKIDDALGTVKLSEVLTKIIKYYVLLIFVQAAVSFVELGTLSLYLSTLLLYVPVLIGGLLVALASVLLGEYVKESITELNNKSDSVKLVARGVKLMIVCVGVTMGLATTGFNTTLITGIFLTLIQAMAFGVALAFAIAFGFGGQEDAKDLIKTTRKNFKF